MATKKKHVLLIVECDDVELAMLEREAVRRGVTIEEAASALTAEELKHLKSQILAMIDDDPEPMH